MESVLTLINSKEGVEDFEDIIRPHLDNMYRLAYRFTASEADAEDLVQEVMVKAYLKKNDITEISNLKAWLAKVLYRTFIDQQRKFWRSPLKLLKTSNHAQDDYDYLEVISSPEPGPAEVWESKIVNRQIHAALKALNPKQRAVCVLHDMEGYTLLELVALLETPIGTLKSRLHRARATLRDKLYKKNEELPYGM
ncbi:MAG: RNA polymerase sigma factor [Desulfobulbaceae bacterium]|nr:RNA polymerase sigma factor [Desulfobulbaceae bacterium]HIJ77792.1 RNA polymerase sigma factor [Deltaproteobacteria bacterium]